MFAVIVNVITVLIGSTVGLLCKKGIPKRLSDAVMLGIGMCTLYIGISGTLKGENTIVLILSMVLGAIIGTALDIDGGINRLGKWIEPRFARRYCEKAGVAVRLVPEEGLPANAFAANFDGAFAPCGEMTDLPAADEPWQLSCGDVAVEISPGQLHLDDSLALCSRYMMLKTE